MNQENNNPVEIESSNFENETQRIYYAPPYQQEYSPSSRGNGFGVAALIMGIFSLILSCCIYISFIFIILGIIFGIIAIAKKSGRGMGIAGLIMSVLAFIASIIFLFALIYSGGLEEIEDSYNYNYSNYDDGFSYYDDFYDGGSYQQYDDFLDQLVDEYSVTEEA